MGYGSYSSADWSKLKTSRNISTSSSVNEIFSSKVNEKYLPRFINKRESRESNDHPHSTPIIIGLDDTGSMGYLSQKIATEYLNETMEKLYSTNAVSDPQLMFAFYGDYWDSYPLQVTQYESDIRIAQQLMELTFEDGGCCCVINPALWYFANEHIVTDKWEKHREKGFIITIGDCADARDELTTDFIQTVFNDQVNSDIQTSDIINKASEKYELLHIIVEHRGITWNYLPGRVVSIDSSSDLDALPEIIISSIQYILGMDEKDILAQWAKEKQESVSYAISRITR